MFAEWIGWSIIRPGDVSVERHGHVNNDVRHLKCHLPLTPSDTNGDQPGYVRATADAARAAEIAADATPDIKLHAQHVQICADNLMRWATEARSLALTLSLGPDASASDRLLKLATAISIGEDINGDGQIAPVAGEGGGLVAYVHAQYMAGLLPASGTY